MCNGVVFSLGFFSNHSIRYNKKIREHCKKNLKYSWKDIINNPKQLFKKFRIN